MDVRDAYDALAGAFRYPDDRCEKRLAAAAATLGEDDAQISAILEPAMEALRALSPTGREELYTRTFDVNPVCSLEVGWHLFGEEYERGAFLVEMRGRLRECGVEEAGELPDHLLHVLPTLGRLPPEEADLLARGFVLPALARMLEGFGERENPYRALLEAVRGWIERRHGPAFARPLATGACPPPYAPACPSAPAADPGRTCDAC